MMLRSAPLLLIFLLSCDDPLAEWRGEKEIAEIGD